MFEETKAVLFDLDGTIYYGSKIIDGANEAIDHCRDCGKRVFFLTNNSTKTRRQIFDKLQGMGISCNYEEVITSGYVSALHVLQNGIKNLYVCGTDNLRLELEDFGIKPVSEDEAENLLIGYDPDFDYVKCTIAVRVAKKAKRLIACNKERVFQGEGAKWFPGCGAMVAPIEWCSNRQVDYVVGKPNTLLLETLCDEFDLKKDEVLMVGDTYESDILMANRFGCPSILISDNEYLDTISVGKICEIANIVF